MSDSRDAFAVRCTCGKMYNSHVQHIGKRLKCVCGRTVKIARSEEAIASEPVWQSSKTSPQPRRRRRSIFGVRIPRFLRPQRRTTVPVANPEKTETGFAHWWRVILAPISDWLGREQRALRGQRPFRRIVLQLSWSWFVVMVVSWMLLITTSESFLPMTLLAYGPRFVLLIPIGLLLVPALMTVRRALLPLALAAFVVVGPIMGGRVSYRTIGRDYKPTPTPGRFRILTLNAEGGAIVATRLRRLVNDVNPDVIAFQECGDALWDSLTNITSLNHTRGSGTCFATRWPLDAIESMPHEYFTQLRKFGYGGAAIVSRQLIRAPFGTFAVVNLHLETARKGLESLMSRDGFISESGSARIPAPVEQPSNSMMRIHANAEIRERESERAAVWAVHGDRELPIFVVGDFNLPVESAIFRRHWGAFQDAFESSGNGLGWSKREGTLLRIRIDHILSNSSAPRAAGAWLGPDVGSDHLPVIADFEWAAR